MAYKDGFIGEGEMSYTGSGAETRARLAIEIVKKWMEPWKDKIEEEKLPLTIVGGRKNKKTLEYGIKLGRRQALQELIEEREEK